MCVCVGGVQVVCVCVCGGGGAPYIWNKIRGRSVGIKHKVLVQTSPTQ